MSDRFAFDRRDGIRLVVEGDAHAYTRASTPANIFCHSHTAHTPSVRVSRSMTPRPNWSEVFSERLLRNQPPQKEAFPAQRALGIQVVDARKHLRTARLRAPNMETSDRFSLMHKRKRRRFVRYRVLSFAPNPREENPDDGVIGKQNRGSASSWPITPRSVLCVSNLRILPPSPRARARRGASAGLCSGFAEYDRSLHRGPAPNWRSSVFLWQTPGRDSVTSNATRND